VGKEWNVSTISGSLANGHQFWRFGFRSLSQLAKRTMKSKSLLLLGAVLCSLLTALHPEFAQGTAFSYQGRLADNASPANGICDLRFTTYDALTNGSAVAETLTNAPAFPQLFYRLLVP
jgi:hypothetical protein